MRIKEAAVEERAPSGATDAEAVQAQLSALADATRTRLLMVLSRHELSVGELCEALELPQSTVSRHLQVLLREGWVVPRAEGTSRYYRMATLAGVPRQLWEAVRPAVETSPAAEADEARALVAIELRRTELEQVFVSDTRWWDTERERLFGAKVELRALVALLDPSWTVADLGCGTGIVADAVAPHVARVVGVDASPFQLKEARRRLRHHANVELHHARLESLPVADACVDVALIMLVLHYLPEPVVALREAARILRPGGRLLILDMTAHAREEYRLRLGHVWQGFERGQLEGWLREAGFGDVRYHDVAFDARAEGPPLFTTVAVKRNGKRRTRRAE